MKQIVSIVLVVILVTGMIAACAPANQAPPAPSPDTPAATPATADAPPPPVAAVASGSLVVATVADPPAVTVARHNSIAASNINRMTHNGLFRICYQTLDPIPDIAESYRAISDVEWEFRLREGILFHNGEEVTAEDLYASFTYARQHPEGLGNLASVVSFEVVDRYTFRVNTGTPNALLLFDLAQQANFVQPASLIESGHDFISDPVGSGPYRFVEWDVGNSISVTAFDDYFDEARAARIRDITWRIIPEGASRTIALEAGEIDFIIEVATPDVPRLQADPNVTVDMRVGTAHHFLILNNENPLFYNNIPLRQAIDMAIDKEAIVFAAFDGLATPTWNQVSTSFPGVSNEGMNTFDPAGARTLLAEHNIDPSIITFEIIASDDQARRVAEIIQANVADIGLSANITMVDLATRLAVTNTPDFDTAVGSFTSNSLLWYLNGVFHSRSIGASSRNRINSPELDVLIDRTIGELDPERRLAAFEDVTRRLNEITPQIPLLQPYAIRAFNSRLIAPELDAVGQLNVNMMYWVN